MYMQLCDKGSFDHFAEYVWYLDYFSTSLGLDFRIMYCSKELKSNSWMYPNNMDVDCKGMNATSYLGQHQINALITNVVIVVICTACIKSEINDQCLLWTSVVAAGGILLSLVTLMVFYRWIYHTAADSDSGTVTSDTLLMNKKQNSYLTRLNIVQTFIWNHINA